MGNQLLAMLNVFENFDSELSLLIEEFKEIRDIFALHKGGFLNDEDKFDLKDLEPYMEISYLKKIFTEIDSNLGAELDNLFFHAKILTKIKNSFNDESKLNDIKSRLCNFYGKYFNFYFSLYGLDKSWIEINKFYKEKILTTSSTRKRYIPKIVYLEDGLIKISGISLDQDVIIKPEGDKDYLDCEPDFDYWVKNIFKIVEREKQWGYTGAYEIAKQINEGQEKDFDPKLLNANITYWNDYCNNIRVQFKDYLRKEDQRKWNSLSEDFFNGYAEIKNSFMDNISSKIYENFNEIENDYIEDDYTEEETSGFVYLIRNQDIYKIGITKNLLKRMDQLKADEVLNVVKCSNYENLEKELHKKFKEYRIPQTEYFRLNKNQLEQVNIEMNKGANF